MLVEGWGCMLEFELATVLVFELGSGSVLR